MPKVHYHWALNYGSKGLTSAPDGGDWSTSCHSCSTPRKEQEYPVEARVGPRASLDIMEKTNTIAHIVHTE